MTKSWLGQMIHDRYRVETLLGSGSMADVYRGYDVVFERAVVIKVLNGGDEATRNRFLDEARVMSNVQHPHILAIYEIGESEGQPYIIMEYVEGSSLAQVSGRRIPFTSLKNIFNHILSALDAAHRQQIVHRDLKPANVLVSKEGVAKVSDFGLSRRVSDLTTGGRRGEVVGTVSYLPPEVFLGRPSDGRGDLYSLGIMMYETFTGRLPFRSENGDIVAVVYAHVHEMPTPPRAIERALPIGLERLILKLLEKDPERRYPNAAAVATEFDSFRFSSESGLAAQEDFDYPYSATEMEPGIRTILDRMLSPQRSTKAAFGKILTAMLAIRRQEFPRALALYDEALLELHILKSEAEYLKGAIGMGDCLLLWLQHNAAGVYPENVDATSLHLESAKVLAQQRGQTRELQTIQRLMADLA